MSIFFKNLPVYYINLDERTDRKEYVENHFKENNIDKFIRVSGINGHQENYLPHILDNPNFGCTASHIKAMQEFYNSDYEYAFICEDDINLSNLKKINFNFFETLIFFNPDLYCLQTTVLTREDLSINFKLHEREFWDFSTASYIINKKYAKSIIDSYIKEDKIFLDNYPSRNIVDYRGGNIITTPVADELVYSLCKTYSLPIFSFIYSKSSIQETNEFYRQIEKSINDFNEYWSKYDIIDLNDLFKE